MKQHGEPKRLVDEIAERLREKIYTGEYVPGDQLRQERLAAELEISRTPLREALRMLERDGLVVVSPSRGVRVAVPQRSYLISAYEVREVIDGLATRLAAASCTPVLETELRHILECQKQALEAWNPQIWTRLNVAFHSAILKHSGNPLLLPQLALIARTTHVLHADVALKQSRAHQVFQEHRYICEVICTRDVEGAEAAARAHIHRPLLALRSTDRFHFRDEIQEGQARDGE
jgi:DNA-binding GntR family transcriptional regulator